MTAREILGNLAQECQSFGANPEQWGSPPDIDQALKDLQTLLEGEAETLYDWQEGSGYAGRTAIPLYRIKKILGKETK